GRTSSVPCPIAERPTRRAGDREKRPRLAEADPAHARAKNRSLADSSSVSRPNRLRARARGRQKADTFRLQNRGTPARTEQLRISVPLGGLHRSLQMMIHARATRLPTKPCRARQEWCSTPGGWRN